MKKNLSLIALAGLVALTLGSCKSPSEDDKNSVSSGSSTSSPSNSSSVEDGGINVNEEQVEILAYQAATGLSTLANAKDPTIKGKNRISDEVKTKIESILPSIDLILSNENNFESDIAESDLEEYEIKQTISFNILDDTENFTLYYNVISEKIDDEDDRIMGHNDSLQTSSSSSNIPPDIEIETKYEGIALIDDTSFPFVGKTESESETEDGETEVETEMEMRITTGEKSYIKIKQEIEVEGDNREEEYKYTVVENDVLSLEFAYELENEKEGKETEVKLVLDNVKYEFEAYTNDEGSFIKVKVEGKDDEDSKVIYQKTVLVDETTGESSIIYTLVE